MTEEALRAHCIHWGVEAAAPQFGTTIAILKGWLRGDNALPASAWKAWVEWSSLPETQRPPIPGHGPPPGSTQQKAEAPEKPSLMTQSPLASRVLNDPAIQARIKAETTPKAVVPETKQAPLIEFGEPEIPIQAPKPNGQTKKALVAFCCPTNRDFPPTVFECLSVLIRNHQMPVILKGETLLPRGRNVIAERFLRTSAEWSFWVDSDMLVPFGVGEWFKDKSKITQLRKEQYAFDALTRLLSHRKDLVGAVYAARTEASQMVIQPDLEPRGQADRDLAEQIRKNQSYGTKEVAWIGFGCALVHRRVFEAVARTDPDIRSGKASFFDTQGSKGEDVRFCERAATAGFRAWLDTELVCGHLGRQCFKPEGTKAK